MVFHGIPSDFIDLLLRLENVHLSAMSLAWVWGSMSRGYKFILHIDLHILIIYLSYTMEKEIWLQLLKQMQNLVAWKQARCSAWQDPQKFSKSKHFKVNLGSIKSLQAISILQEQRGHWRIDLSDHFILYKTLVGLTWTQDEKLATHQYSKYLNTKLTWWIHVNTVNTFAFLKFHIVACCFGGSFLSSWPCDESHTVQQLRRTPKESWCTSARSTRNNEKDFAWLRHVGMSGKRCDQFDRPSSPPHARDYRASKLRMLASLLPQQFQLFWTFNWVLQV